MDTCKDCEPEDGILCAAHLQEQVERESAAYFRAALVPNMPPFVEHLDLDERLDFRE